MKITIKILLLLILHLNLQSQNLILNGDFENLELDKVPNWKVISGTPDIINLKNIIEDYTWMTNKRFFKGIKNQGFVGYAFTKHFTEVIGTELKNSLEKDSIYDLKVKILTGHSCRNGLAKMTIGLTTEELENSKRAKNYQTDIVELSTLTNKIEGGSWIELKTKFQAKGGEKFLSLGNFNKLNIEYMKDNRELMVEGNFDESCNYLIVDEISLIKKLDESKQTKLKISTPPIVIEDIAFDFGKWKINENYQEQLLLVVKEVKQRKGKFTITGYTDNIGSEEENKILSLRRATAIQDFFILNGVDSKRIKVIGKGENFPKFSNDSEISRAKNRRVEIQFK